MNRTDLTLKLLGISFKIPNVLVKNARLILGVWMVVGAVVLAVLPILAIASLNTLFPGLAIAYGWGEYASMALILLILLSKN